MIDNPQINTVGGFVVRCIYENNTYKFLGNFIVSSSKPQVLNKNDVINFDSSRAEGGFSFISKESCGYYCGCFKQINKCIIYKEGYSDNSYKYISMPYIIDNNENL